MMESMQRIMIRTQIFRNRLPSHRSIEHPAECPAIHNCGVNFESDNAPSVMVHADQHPYVRNVADSHRNTSML